MFFDLIKKFMLKRGISKQLKNPKNKNNCKSNKTEYLFQNAFNGSSWQNFNAIIIILKQTIYETFYQHLKFQATQIRESEFYIDLKSKMGKKNKKNCGNSLKRCN